MPFPGVSDSCLAGTRSTQMNILHRTVYICTVNESERLSGSYWAALRFIWGGIIQIGGEHYDER
jgi:hypothetical protein|nr:MAG TPA: hypothetical protein [Caudoviricetes sp.]